MRAMLLGCILATGFGPAGAAEVEEYRRLSTSELDALLRGSTISQPEVRQSYAGTVEDFERSGTYIRHTDNYEGRGKYMIRDHSICVTDELEKELCRQVMIGRDGQYWITKRNDKPGLVKISVDPIRK